MAITAAIKALLTMVPADWEPCDGTFFDFSDGFALFLPMIAGARIARFVLATHKVGPTTGIPGRLL
jgi:hypothetical protein